MTYRPLPSPNKTNNEGLYYKIVRRQPRAAYDAAPMPSSGGFDKAKFRAAVDWVLDQCRDEGTASAIRGVMDEFLPSGHEEEAQSSMRKGEGEPVQTTGKVYGESEDQEAEWDRDREEEGEDSQSDGPVSESFFHAADSRRGARDHRLAQDRANADWLGDLVGRIKSADDLR